MIQFIKNNCTVLFLKFSIIIPSSSVSRQYYSNHRDTGELRAAVTSNSLEL